VKGYRVLIRPDDIQEVTDWGFELNSTEDASRREQNAQNVGTVLDIGHIAFKAYDPDRTQDKWYKWCEIGEKVIYNMYSMKLVPDPENKDKKLAIVSDDDILGSFEEGEE